MKKYVNLEEKNQDTNCNIFGASVGALTKISYSAKDRLK